METRNVNDIYLCVGIVYLFLGKKINKKSVMTYTAQKMKFFIKDFFSKCDQIGRKLRICSYLLKKSLIENFIFCAVLSIYVLGNAQLIPSVYSFNSLFQFENFEKVKQEFLMHPWINTFLRFSKYKLHQGAVLKYSDMMY